MSRDATPLEDAVREATVHTRARLAEARPGAARLLEEAFRRDLSVYRWGSDHVEVVLDALGLSYRDQPGQQALSGVVALVNGGVRDLPEASAVRDFVLDGGWLITTGEALRLLEAAFPETFRTGSLVRRGPRAAQTRLDWLLPEGVGRWRIDAVVPEPLLGPLAQVEAQDGTLPLVSSARLGDGGVVHITGHVAPWTRKEVELAVVQTMCGVLVQAVVDGLAHGAMQKCARLAASHTTRDTTHLDVRWHRDAGGGRMHFLARLDDDTWGLHIRLGKTWTWVEGDRATVLATVPERWFAEVVAAS